MLPGWLLGEPVVREEEDSVLRALAVREEEDSPSHLGESTAARESPSGLELGHRVGGRPLAAPLTTLELRLSIYGRQQERV